MDCYCKKLADDGQWENLAKDKFEDGEAHCRWKGFNKGMAIASSTLDASSIVILNGIVSVVFKYLGEFQQMPTVVEQDHDSFDQIVLIEFFNTGIVTMILVFSGISEFQYRGFEPSAYKTIGNSLVVTIFLATIISNIDVKASHL